MILQDLLNAAVERKIILLPLYIHTHRLTTFTATQEIPKVLFNLNSALIIFLRLYCPRCWDSSLIWHLLTLKVFEDLIMSSVISMKSGSPLRSSSTTRSSNFRNEPISHRMNSALISPFHQVSCDCFQVFSLHPLCSYAIVQTLSSP